MNLTFLIWIFIFLLLVGLGFFVYSIVIKDGEGDGKENGDGQETGEGEEVKKVVVYKCHGSNFNRPVGGYDIEKYDTVCDSDLDFKWSPAVSCDKDELDKMIEKGRVRCPEGYSYIEGPERKLGEKCKNGKEAFGFKCYRRRGYYDYDAGSRSYYSALRALECCSGRAAKAGKKCSGRFCPRSNLCYKILDTYCKKAENRDKEDCLEFCSKEKSGFPQETPQDTIIRINTKYGTPIEIVEK